MTEETIFAELLEKKAPSERAAFLDNACAGNPELRQRVEALLRSHEGAGNFLQQPAVTPAETAAFETAAPIDQDVGTRIGPYKLLQKIGEGGMGVVYMAERSEPMQRRVALKIIKPGMDSTQVIARFEAERQALALMDHPNIAKVLEAGMTNEPGLREPGVREPGVREPGLREPGCVSAGSNSPPETPRGANATPLAGHPYFVMELVKGIAITRYCDENHFTPRERLELLIPVCQAVQHAHQKGIIHRDLKPANVLVTEYDGHPVAKVIDFGVAKATSQRLTDHTMFTAFGSIVGTLEYMSPEQARINALDVDTRSDIYSLGVILYELLTGSTPFERKRLRDAALDEMLRIIREEEPQKPSTRLSDASTLPNLAAQRRTEPAKLTKLVRGELDWIVMKALEKDRGRRYETANGMSRDLQRYLADEAVEACPPSNAYRLRRFARRNKGPMLAAGTVLLALVAGIIGTSWGMIRAEQAWHAEAGRAESERLAKLDAEAARQKEAARAEAEKLAKNEAQMRLLQIEKGTDILGSIFADLDPHAEEKEGKPLREILGQRVMKASKQLDGESIADALAVAKLQNILGVSLIGLGHYSTAAALLEKVSATNAAKLGEDHADTLTSRNDLASAYSYDGKLELAIPLFERTLKACEAKLGDNHPDTLSSRNNLAVSYKDAGKLELAIPLFERTLKASQAKLGDNHRETMTYGDNLASAYRDAGKLELAIPLLERVVKASEAKLGDDHPDTLISRASLAGAYQEAGRLDLAIPLLERTLKACEAKLGDDHPTTFVSRSNLALAYEDAGKLDLAIPLFERALKAFKAKLGDDHPNTLKCRNNLAFAYRLAGKLDLAIPLMERTLKALKTKLGDNHPWTLSGRNNLAEAYESAGKLDLAIPLLKGTLKGREAKLGDDHPDTLRSRNNLAKAYIHAGNLDLAIVLLEPTLKASKAKLGDDHPNTLTYTNNLASSYESAGKLDRAIPLFEGVVLVQRKQYGNDDIRLAGALAPFGLAMLAAKRPTDAEPVLHECLAIRMKKEPEAWTTFNTKSMLGGSLLGQKKYADAEPLLLAGYEGMKQREAKISPQFKVRLTEALERLVQLYDALGKKDKAELWRKELASRKTPQKK